MIKLINITLGLWLLLAACTTSSETPTITPGSAPTEKEDNQSGDIRFLALGDSYTIGQSVSEDQRWPVLMVEELRRGGKSIAPPEIIARTGWTTGDLIRTLNENPPAKKYDLVSLMIGVNNQYQGMDTEEYKSEFQLLLKKAISYADGGKNRVFVLSIPDWSVTPYASGTDKARMAAEIDKFNDVARQECKKGGVSFVDITPVSRTALHDNGLVAIDGLHYSGKMHKLWVNEAILIVNKKL
jgi:lysophospholipase L1-like esterase